MQSKIEEIIKPSLNDMGYQLWGCECLFGRRSAVLRIYIDKEGGVDIHDCELVSRRVSALLDVEDPIVGNYRLEISSPGLPRPLFYGWQYEYYVGSHVQIKLSQPIEGKRKYVGNIITVDKNGVELQLEHQRQYFLFSNIAKANLSDLKI